VDILTYWAARAGPAVFSEALSLTDLISSLLPKTRYELITCGCARPDLDKYLQCGVSASLRSGEWRISAWLNADGFLLRYERILPRERVPFFS